MPAKLVGPVVKLGKQKIITGIIIDVLGDLCSVQLSNQGAVLHSLKYIGPAPLVGDTVFVDYRSGKPVVHTNSNNLEATITQVQQALTAATTSVNVTPAPAPETVPGVDAVRRFVDQSAAPTVNDDETLGYEVTDIWEYAGETYIARDVTEGAADWLQIGTGGGGGGAEYLDDLIDVHVPAPTDGYVLTYDAYLGLWVDAEPAAGGGGTLMIYDDLSSQIPATGDHFDLSNEATNEILLFYNGTFQSTATFAKDMDNLGITLDFSPVSGDKLVAVYGIEGTVVQAQPPPAYLRVLTHKGFR